MGEIVARKFAGPFTQQAALPADAMQAALFGMRLPPIFSAAGCAFIAQLVWEAVDEAAS